MSVLNRNKLNYKSKICLKRMIVALTFTITVILGLTGCVTDSTKESSKESEEESVKKMESNTYMQITADAAKSLMESESNYLILDVRTEEEYAEGHIFGAILIPDYEIEAKAELILKDKEQLILVYCRSGRRSKRAAEQLVAMGYRNVKEFGGIIDWPYEITTE